jgi:hypothetical protein
MNYKSSLLAAAFALATQSAQAQTAPAWMAGYWLSCENGEQVSETWTIGGKELLLGSSITHAKDGTHFEMMRIGKGAGGGLSLFSSPDGVPPTEFALKSQDANRVTFENPAHDFPQRIIYARDGKILTARIEGRIKDRDEAMDWRYVAAALNAACTAK